MSDLKAIHAPSIKVEHPVNIFWTVATYPNLQFDDGRIAKRLTTMCSKRNVNNVNLVDILYRL